MKENLTDEMITYELQIVETSEAPDSSWFLVGTLLALIGIFVSCFIIYCIVRNYKDRKEHEKLWVDADEKTKKEYRKKSSNIWNYIIIFICILVIIPSIMLAHNSISPEPKNKIISKEIPSYYVTTAYASKSRMDFNEVHNDNLSYAWLSYSITIIFGDNFNDAFTENVSVGEGKFNEYSYRVKPVYAIVDAENNSVIDVWNREKFTYSGEYLVNCDSYIERKYGSQ